MFYYGCQSPVTAQGLPGNTHPCATILPTRCLSQADCTLALCCLALSCEHRRLRMHIRTSCVNTWTTATLPHTPQRWTMRIVYTQLRCDSCASSASISFSNKQKQIGNADPTQLLTNPMQSLCLTCWYCRLRWRSFDLSHWPYCHSSLAICCSCCPHCSPRHENDCRLVLSPALALL